jgi:nucleoside diphosphate kinase
VPPSGTPARETAALLKTLDGLEPNAYGCSRGLACLADLDARGLSYALGANAVNRAMSLCANEDAARPEALFHRLAERGLADTASFQIVAASRLSRGALPEAAAATAELLARVERDGRCPAKIAAQCRTVLDACRSAGLDEAAATAEARWEELRIRGLLSSLEPPAAERTSGAIERTLAVLKPDALRGGHEDAIVDFVQTSWGMGAGDTRRRFFREYAAFYASGEALALLLEREDAISHWRALLGPGDPSVGRRSEPESVRARWGTNKQANACHGADSPRAAARECAWFFGEEWGELEEEDA